MAVNKINSDECVIRRDENAKAPDEAVSKICPKMPGKE